MTMTRRFGLVLAACVALLIGGAPTPPAHAEGTGPVIFAAASLKEALGDAAAAWTRSGKPAPKLNFAASNTLAKQIEQGAPADLFFSADLDWMSYLDRKGLVQPRRVNLLANAIVLIAPKASTVSLDIVKGFDLASALGEGKLAMGNVAGVPAGKYGKAALETLGVWNAVKDKVAQAESVRAALLLVSRGEAPFGIVYATDAIADPSVRVVGTFPENTHPPIIYPVAVVKAATNPEATAFLAFLRGPEAKAAFEKQGFTVLNQDVGTF